MVLKRTFLGRCSKSTAAACHRRTAEEALPAGWLEERQQVDAVTCCKWLMRIHLLVARD